MFIYLKILKDIVETSMVQVSHFTSEISFFIPKPSTIVKVFFLNFFKTFILNWSPLSKLSISREASSPSTWVPDTGVEDLNWVLDLVSTWPHSGCCRHLGNELMDGMSNIYYHAMGKDDPVLSTCPFSPKVVHTFNVVSVKIPVIAFKETDKLILKFGKKAKYLE